MSDTAIKHALEYRRCTARDIMSVKDGGEGDAATQAVLDASDKYLGQFVAPAKDADGKPACFHCGRQLSSFAQMFGTGVAYEWGLAHGEARCSGCKWPARGMH